MKNSQKYATRLSTMLARQPESRWLGEYEPAIRATREEAPSISRPTILFSAKLGRHVHLLSQPEVAVAVIALYNPALFDLHEQRMLYTEPSDHPLRNHLKFGNPGLPPLRGTVAAADDLDLLRWHPTFYQFATESSAEQLVPFPLVGDFLFFLCDETGAYCKNGTVKKNAVDFSQRRLRRFHRPRKDESDEGTVARHEIERHYYLDARIETVQITEEDIVPDVFYNLRELFLWHARPLDLSDDARARIRDHFGTAVGTGVLANELVDKATRDLHVAKHTAHAILKQAIWQREIRVDLWQPLHMDQPLRPETRDVLDHHKHWFQR